MSSEISGRGDEVGLVLSGDARAEPISYSGVVLKNAVVKWWNQPAVADPPPRSINDWIIVGVLVVATLIEPFFRDDLWMPGLAVVLGLVAVVPLLWRRSHPLPAVFVAFTSHALTEIIPNIAGEESIYMNSGLLYALLLPYSLFRWGSGRHAAYGFAFIVATHYVSHPFTLMDAAFVVVFFMFPAEVGASIRYRDEARRRQIERAKLEERQEIARELHDTVAHHVSAIAVRAQAGRVQAEVNPDDAVAALQLIESEASRTLAEMRAMVDVLRSNDHAQLTPQPGVGDLSRFARNGDDLPQITVDVSEETGDPAPQVGAAIYRIAQESITNALRHARDPQQIAVAVDGDDEWVRISVTDDGAAVSASTPDSGGFGVVGMKERAKLLGGSLRAGPHDGRGWRVEAALPRAGAAR